MTPEQKLYSDLLIKCVSNSIYKDDIGLLHKRLHNDTITISDASRAVGMDWPSKAHSMAGLARLNNVRDLAQRAIDEKVPGDFIETGVWRGGCCILMRGILAINQIKDRKVYVADSFEGLPKSDLENFPKESTQDFSIYEELSVSLDQVKANFAAYDFLDSQVEFIKGYFSESLPAVKANRFALLRLDGDLYESTIVALDNLYPKLSPGGFVIIDDYGALPACRDAVDDYRSKHLIVEELEKIDEAGVWWQKPL
jgi:O-methyltransferase